MVIYSLSGKIITILTPLFYLIRSGPTMVVHMHGLMLFFLIIIYMGRDQESGESLIATAAGSASGPLELSS